MTGNRTFILLGVVLLAGGLIGHLMAAHVEGHKALYYQHHIFGFVILTIGAAVIVWGVSRFFWRGRHDITLLIVGALQTIFGILIYLSFASKT